MKEIKLTEQGNYLYGVLDGVDLVASGVLENGTQYGASVKLKFITKITVIKIVAGMEIPTKKAISQIIKIPSTDTELPSIVNKYNELIGKELLIGYGTIDNNVFTVIDDKSISIVK